MARRKAFVGELGSFTRRDLVKVYATDYVNHGSNISLAGNSNPNTRFAKSYWTRWKRGDIGAAQQYAYEIRKRWDNDGAVLRDPFDEEYIRLVDELEGTESFIGGEETTVTTRNDLTPMGRLAIAVVTGELKVADTISATPHTEASKRAHQLVTDRNISIRRAWQIIQREAQLAAYDKPEVKNVPHNQKAMIITALYTNGKAKNVEQLMTWVRRMGFDKMDAHNLVHAVWAVQKDGHVRFRENKRPVQGAGSLERIELTSRGMAKAIEMQEAARNVKAIPVARSNGKHQVGTDMTDPANHKAKAVGGEIERRYVEPQPIERKPQKPITEIAADAPIINPPVTNGTTLAVDVVEPDPRVYDWDKYPLINAARQKASKRGKIEAAAKLLEEAGDFDDDVLRLLERVQVDPIESEILALLRDLRL